MKFTPPIPSCSNENFCFHVGDYSFGFNGKDKESEFNSGAYDFGARIHDARLGRWMSVDPMFKMYPFISSYSFAANSPIFYVDHAGQTITPYCEEIDRAAIEGDWDRLFIKKNGENIMAGVLKRSFDSQKGLYTDVNPKEFRKALRGLSPDQKAIARGYYKIINDSKDLVIRGIGSAEEITFKELGSITPFSSKTKTAILNSCGYGPDATAFSLSALGSPALTILSKNTRESLDTNGGVVLYATDRTLQKVDAVKYSDPFDGNAYKTLPVAFSTMVEARGHEIIGHYGFDSGVIKNQGVNSWVTAMQVSNIIRRIEADFEFKHGQDYEVRTGKDHYLGEQRAADIQQIPEGLKK